MVKHHIQIQGARHVAQLNTVANKDKGGKMFAPQTFFRGLKNVSTFGNKKKSRSAELHQQALQWAISTTSSSFSLRRRYFSTGIRLR